MFVAVIVVFEKFSVELYLVGSEVMSLKVDFPTKYRIHVYYHNWDFPQEVNPIITSLYVVVYRLYVNCQGMPKTSWYCWLYTGRSLYHKECGHEASVTYVASFSFRTFCMVMQDPTSLINLFAKFLDYVPSCKVFTLWILVDSAKKYQWSILGHDGITSLWLSFYVWANHRL